MLSPVYGLKVQPAPRRRMSARCCKYNSKCHAKYTQQHAVPQTVGHELEDNFVRTRRQAHAALQVVDPDDFCRLSINPGAPAWIILIGEHEQAFLLRRRVNAYLVGLERDDLGGCCRHVARDWQI